MSEGAQILIVEDEKDMTNLLRRVLTEEGYTVEIAETGAEALQKVEDNQFYLAILDIRLPDISGMEVLRTLSERQPQIPVVVLTGYPSRETAEEARQLGVKEYITKPLDLEQLKEVVREIVEEYIGCLPTEEANPLDISVADFHKLSDEQRENLQIEAYKQNEDWILQELNRLKAMWIFVCGSKVIKSSPSLDDYPSPAKLREIEESENIVPFVFVRPLMLRRWNERRTGISKWQSRSPIDDWYTTIQIKVGRPDWEDNAVIENGILILGEFDSGCQTTHLDLQQLLDQQIIVRADLGPTHHNYLQGEEFRYYVVRVKAAVSPVDDKPIVATLNCCAVRDLLRLLANPDVSLEALVGRDILIKLPAKIILDGTSRTTIIIAH